MQDPSSGPAKSRCGGPEFVNRFRDHHTHDPLGSQCKSNGSLVTAADRTSHANPRTAKTRLGRPPLSSEKRLLRINARHCARFAESELKRSDRPTVFGSMAVPRFLNVARTALTRSCPSKVKARERWAKS